ncbi:hypothetical protein [Saccharicrinis aurantiacus]|uniref:hypothetical protein n=1 Tax=Saccharicrinis aurantiacus TaxID=1849719 RepID=UPI002490AC94|nr:hypothetical protein [Saccharicrinis aurantiacus]
MFFSCEKEGDVQCTDSHIISVAPPVVVFKQEEASKSIYLSTQSHNSTKYKITDLPDWLSTPTEDGTIDNEIVEIELLIDRDNIEAGMYHDSIFIINDKAGLAKANIIMYVDAIPQLDAPTDIIKLNISNPKELVELTNTGNCDVYYVIESNAGWLQARALSSESYYGNFISMGDTVDIEITSDVSGLAAGIYSDTVKINYAEDIINIPVNIEVSSSSYIIVDQNEINFDSYVVSNVITVLNQGNIDANVQLSYDEDILIIEDSEPAIKVNEEVSLNIRLNTESLDESQLIETEIVISTDDQTFTIPVTIDYKAELKTYLNLNVIDADFNNTTNLLVIASSTPSALTIIDVTTEQKSTFDLVYTPTCLSISTDGTKCAVGHDASVSYIDLVDKKVISNHNIAMTCKDIIMKNNEWAYVSNLENDWDYYTVASINMASGGISGSQNPYYRFMLASYPGKDYIYTVTNGVSPASTHKYVINGDVAEYAYKTSYHGDYSMGTDLWITNNGQRIVTSYGNTFTISEDQGSDMKYAGKVIDSGQFGTSTTILSAWDIPSNDQFVIISAQNSWGEIYGSQIEIINATNLNYEKTINLENYYTSNNGSVNISNAIPVFIFYSDTEEKLYAITKAYESTLLNSWALQSVDHN